MNDAPTLPLRTERLVLRAAVPPDRQDWSKGEWTESLHHGLLRDERVG